MTPRSRILLLIGAGVLVLLVGAWLYLRGPAGVQFATGLAARFGVTITYEDFQGSLLGGGRFDDLRVAGDGWAVEADRAVIDWDFAGLRNRHIRIDSLEAGALVVRLREDDSQDEAAGLPSLDFGWDIQVDQARIGQLRVLRDDAQIFGAEALAFSGQLAEGRLTLPRFSLEEEGRTWTGEALVDSAANYRHEIRLAGDLPDTALSLQAEGDAARSEVSYELPGLGITGRGILHDWADSMRWETQLVAQEGALGGLSTTRVEAQGDLDRALVNLSTALGDTDMRAREIEARLVDGRVHLSGGTVSLPEHMLTLRPDLYIALQGEPLFEGSADFRWTGSQGRIDGAAGELQIRGNPENYALEASGQAGDEVTFDLEAQGNAEGLTRSRLDAHGPLGELRAEGSLAWGEDVQWAYEIEGRRLNPAYLDAQWPGSLSLSAFAQGSGLQGTAQVRQLAGTLRGREVQAEGRLSFSPQGVTSFDADLVSAGSRVAATGQWTAEVRRIDAVLDVSDLADLWPDTHGAVAGTVQLGPAGLALDLSGEALATPWGDAAELQARGLLALRDLDESDLSLSLIRGELRGIEIPELDLSLKGLREDVLLTATGTVERFGEIDLRARGDVRLDPYRIELERLRVASERYGSWNLQDPTRIFYGENRLELDEACINTDPGYLCVQAQMTRNQAGEFRLQLHDLPAALLQPGLSAAVGEPVVLEGDIEAVVFGQTRGFTPESFAGRVRTESLTATLVGRPDARTIRFEALGLSATGDREAMDVQGQAVVDQAHISLDARVVQPFQPDAAQPLSGEITADLPSLASFEGVVPGVAGLRGSLTGQFRLFGTLRQPDVEGTIQATELGFTVSEYGTRVEGAQLNAQLGPRDRLRVEATLPTNQGVLDVDGILTLDGTRVVASDLSISGDDVIVADTPETYLRVSPRLTLSGAEGALRLGGRLQVDEARIALGESEQRVKASPDVVVVGQQTETEDTGPQTQLTTNVTVDLAGPVRFEGYGLQASLSGQVQVIDRPGRQTRARGELRLTGKYEAYGQELEIESGRLIYSDTPIDDPAIALEATREVEDVRAGVRVTGRASAPELEVYSVPGMDQSDAMAYLMLGRPLNQASTGEANYVSNAALAAALNQGSNALGAEMGFDEFGFAVRDSLGGAAFSIGRYLSPKLYLSYSIGLVDPIDILQLEYRHNERWSLRTEIGEETRAAIRYRIETNRPRSASPEERATPEESPDPDQ